MKKIFWIISVALLALTACHREAPDNDPVGVAMIVKNGQIDYFRQIETSFREICQEKGLEAYYYSTSSETAYQEQLTAVTELRKLGKSALKGIIFSPSYGINGENAEAEVAALARERGIPVIIIDAPVKTNGPLASSPYIGTDNTAAGEAMAKLIQADKVAAFAMINSPGITRATAFKALKPDAEVFRVNETCNDEVQAALDKYNDFVFFNGNDLLGALPMLMEAGKRVYTFDVYGEFLDEMIAGSPCLRGVMAQNTFAMARKAVEAVLAANGKPGEMVPTFYLTTATLDAEEAQPFLKFYGKQVPDLKVAENIIGKWMLAGQDGRPAVTNRKKVLTFASTTKAYISASLEKTPEGGSRWDKQMEADVTISGNKVTLISHPEENATMEQEYIITSISDTQFSANHKLTTTVDGKVVFFVEDFLSYTKVTENYADAIIGIWEGRCTSEGSEFDDGKEHRWAYKADGTYTYYEKDGDTWVPGDNTLNEYFVEGKLLCTRWIDNGVENREWWEITIDDDKMNWTALRQDPGGEPYTVTFGMTYVPGIALIAKNGQTEYWRQIESAFRKICLEKGFNAYYCSTSADNAYYEQIAAVEELSRNGKDALKGILFAPCYGPDGQSAEEEVAALAGERGIPVIILDSPVTPTGPLASRPFIGTDNPAAGKELAGKVTADKVVAFAMVNTPGVKRAQAFMTVKPATELITVSESAASEVEAALSSYDDFVFFNGSILVDVLATLKNAGKRVYTFDIYEDSLDELIAGGSCLQGIMAQNTFVMACKGVEAVLEDSKEGQFVPTFFITTSNITSPDVQPYLEYYGKNK